MTREALYTLEELAQAANVTPRAIRYYAAKGLLPAPQSRGRYALYGAAHRNRLHLIGLLKQAFLPIAAMRDQMLHLTDAQVLDLLTSSESHIVTLHAEANPSAATPPFETPETAADPLTTEQIEAYQYLLDALTARQDARDAKIRQGDKETRRQGEREIEDGSRNSEAETLSTLHFPLPMNVPSIPETEMWQRIALAPGVELHVCASMSALPPQQLERLIAQMQLLWKP